MERESFEDEEVAAVLNQHYIAIKVDREERPDIDAIYMGVCQAMTGHGGWPLTILMTPEKKPFFAGTYFPKKSSRGMPGLMDILEQISEKWKQNKDLVLAAGDKIVHTLETSVMTTAEGDISPDVLNQTYQYFANNFDAKYGGFGPAPKFPSPHNLAFLLRHWKLTGEAKALEMVEKTLISMYQGGIYDHIGFGFARYSTDRQWLIPHFEKMLYDNALLSITYLEAFQATGKEEYAQAGREIFSYILRDMTSPEGGFYSAEDADSEGEEGKFYVWLPDEIKMVLGDELGEDFSRTFDITADGNFEGLNIPNLIKTGSVDRLEAFAAAREKLFLHREKRIHPYKDDKILTAWNGLMIAALAFGSRALGETKYSQAAARAADFIQVNLRREDGRLLARYRDGEAAHLAYVDDYAFLIWGLIELYQATFKPSYLALALELNEDMLKYFWDEDKGGLFLYGWDGEKLITRPKEIYDGAMPAGNSVAAVNFLRLASLTGQRSLEERALAQFKAFGGTINATPMGHSHFLTAVQFSQTATVEVTLVGDPETRDMREMLATVNEGFSPETVLVVKPLGREGEELSRLIPLIEGREAVDGKATAYVCRDFSCRPPTTDIQEFTQLL
jgi:uncharacterized protein YyaL (SSP411 family)